MRRSVSHADTVKRSSWVSRGFTQARPDLPDGCLGYEPAGFLYLPDLRYKGGNPVSAIPRGTPCGCISLGDRERSRETAQFFAATRRTIGFSLDLIEVAQPALFDIAIVFD